MSEKIGIIFEEISQLCGQYKEEVPGGRRAWPVSIRERVFELRELGLSYLEISKRSGIAIATIYAWKLKSKTSRFVPVKVVKNSRSNPTVTVRKSVPAEVPVGTPTVTVVTPGGFRIENLRVSDVADLFFSLERGSVK